MSEEMIDEYMYVVEDCEGNTEAVKESEALSRLNQNPRWKLHVYRRFRTLGEVRP